MKKYIALGLLSTLALTSCGSGLDDTKEKNIETIQQEHPVTQKKLESLAASGSVGSGNTTETGSGNTTEISKSTTSSGSQTADLIAKEKTKEAEHSEFISSLLDIEKNRITVPLIDEKEFNNFVNDNSGSVFIGNEEDWKRALSLPCESATGISLKIYSRFAINYDNPEHSPLQTEAVCVKNIEDNDSLESLFSQLNNGAKKEFSSSEIDPERLKSDLDPHSLKPKSPLERLLSSEFFYGHSVSRFVTAKPFKNEILMIYIHSQEPGIGYYYLVRIYLKDGKLYIKESSIDPLVKEYKPNTPYNPLDTQFAKALDPKYGTRFKERLETEIYDVATNREDRPLEKIDPEKVRLLKGDWFKNPSIINRKIEERLINDLQNLVSK